MKVIKLLMLFCMFFMFSSCMSTPPIISKTDGVQSISIVKYVKLNGIEQYISIRGSNINNPILVVLHGGPGTAVMPLSRIYNRELEDYFIVVNWDQRGAGKSKINKDDYSSLTMNNFVDDTYQLVKYLCKEYKKSKVYIMGHSWGTLVGINFCYYHPELVEKYFSIGQVVDIKFSEEAAYQYLLKTINNPEDKIQLANIGQPINGWYKNGISGFNKQRELLLKYGGVLYNKSNFDEYTNKAIFSSEYGFFFNG